MIKKIPLSRPKIDGHEIKAVANVLRTGWLTYGPKTTDFEREFAKYIGVKYAVAMNSCTSALFLSILANGITGEVLVPGFTFVASANAIVTAGAKPVFVDINYHDCNINPDILEDYITPRTEALMVVHYAGQCCQMDKIVSFTKKHNLLLIEDSAENIGGTYKGKMAGSWGIGCFSFFPTKNITTGEGGMFTTNDELLANKIRALVGHGIDKTTLERYNSGLSWHRVAIYPGFNFRLSNILAAIGVEQMKKIESMNSARIKNSNILINKLSHIAGLELPMQNKDCKHVYQMFTLKVGENMRNKIIFGLRDKGIEASVHFDPPVHLHPAYSSFRSSRLPVSEQVSKKIITLPMYPGLTERELAYIAEEFEDCYLRGLK